MWYFFYLLSLLNCLSLDFNEIFFISSRQCPPILLVHFPYLFPAVQPYIQSCSKKNSSPYVQSRLLHSSDSQLLPINNIKVERFTLFGLVFIKQTTDFHPVIPSSSREACVDLLPSLELPLICILNALHLVLCVTMFALHAVLCMVFTSVVSRAIFFLSQISFFFAYQHSYSFFTFNFLPRFFLSHTISVNRVHAGCASTV